MEFKRDLKVGLFVLLGLVLAGLVIFMIGDERRLFDRSVTFRTTFADVQGLKRGAPVQMGGVRVGHVTVVRYSHEVGDDRVHVELEIVASEAPRIRSDTVATIIPKGLLGDRQIKLTKGSEGEQVPPGGTLPSTEPGDMMATLDTVAGKAEKAIDHVGDIAAKLSDERLHRDLRQSVRALNVLLETVTEGEGYPHRFLSDPAEAERISRTIDSLDKSASEFNLTLRELRHAVARVRTGPGFAHDVIYGDGPSKEIAQIGGAADELASTLRGVRQGDGFAHDLLYGGRGAAGDVLSNVTAITADLRDIVRGVKQGRGTVGALLVDPSVYEDIKRVLGNVGRNSTLRALVRYSIRRDEPKAQVDGAGAH